MTPRCRRSWRLPMNATAASDLIRRRRAQMQWNTKRPWYGAHTCVDFGVGTNAAPRRGLMNLTTHLHVVTTPPALLVQYLVQARGQRVTRCLWGHIPSDQ
jgi:hypothetical protein